MGAIDTNYTFTATDVITSTKMNNILDQSTITSSAIFNNTLAVSTGGQLLVKAGGITSNEIAANAVVTGGILDGAVTASKLAAGAAIPAGAVMPFAMNSIPSGWLGADGAAVSRTTYAALFAALSTLYGAGDGSTTFNLPDLRGYFVRGAGTNSDGTASGTFGGKQADELKSHTHTMYVHTGTSSGPSTNSARFDNYFGLGSSTTQATGGTETRPVNIAMLYCIKH